MKLICLNTWGGKAYEPLMKFVREQASSTDIFCFQEVFRSPNKDIETTDGGTKIHLFDELTAALPNFNGVFHLTESGSDENGPVGFDSEIGVAEFAKKSLPLLSSGNLPLFADKKIPPADEPYYPKNLGYIKIGTNNGILTVLNFHGLTFKRDNKLDTPERLEQSRIIKEFAAKETNPVIICGDFNILPEAESIGMLSGQFVDLIKKYGIESTRSKLSPWHGKLGEYKFSDYVFASPEIGVAGFAVPDEEISDHLPLILEFN